MGVTGPRSIQHHLFTSDIMKLLSAIPVFRIFSVEKAKEFYLDYLGFSLDWEHQYEDNFPLYLQVSRSGLTIHLSEHHGDSTPGSTAFIPVEEIETLHTELSQKDYRFAKPGIDTEGWGRVMQIADPFGNRLRFCEFNKEEA